MRPFAIPCCLLSLFLLQACDGGGRADPGVRRVASQRVIVMVWDGLRPDAINAVDTPNLDALRGRGVWFADHHSTYPTLTMMNASSFATGAFPKTSGFYGNAVWNPPRADGTIPVGRTASGGAVDFGAPVSTEDHAVLSTLDAYHDDLLLVRSLFGAAQRAGLRTAAVGKAGPVFLQDLKRGGVFIDEDAALPRAFAEALQRAGFALPKHAPFALASDAPPLANDNGDPTGRIGGRYFALPNGVDARDPTDPADAPPEDASNRYLMKVFTDHILPDTRPDLSVLWFRTPDDTEHAYGPGSMPVKRALASQDRRLGELEAALKAAGLEDSTNLVVVSDHGHSTVSGPTKDFPLRTIRRDGTNRVVLGGIDPVHGYSTSGAVRSADLLTFAGFDAYDGRGCATSAMSGIRADGTPLLPVRVDVDGSLCGTAGTRYQAVSASRASPVASFRLPARLPAGAIVVANNGGTDYFYVPDHDAGTVANLVRFLQSREEYGAVFVDGRYGTLPGTLPLALVKLENPTRRDRGQPDVVVSFAWDAEQRVGDRPGTVFASVERNRGQHASFSPVDVHNTLLAAGPGFRRATTITLPTGNVDLAPTVAALFGLALREADGRVLDEALAKPVGSGTASVVPSILRPATPATDLAFKSALDPTGASIDMRLRGRYSIDLAVKDLTVDGRTYRYFDFARAVRD